MPECGWVACDGVFEFTHDICLGFAKGAFELFFFAVRVRDLTDEVKKLTQ